MTRLKLLVSITDKGFDQNIQKKYQSLKLPFQLNFLGKGSASKSLLAYFGLDEVKKNITCSLIPESLEGTILYQLQEKEKLYEPGNGIAFTIPLCSAPKYLANVYEQEPKKEVYQMTQKEDYQLIVTIVKEGYFDLVMDAAKKKGATGGTLLHGLGMQSKEASRFLGIHLDPEKDIILILASSKTKTAIMESITEVVGITSEAMGITFSLPVDHAIGLTKNLHFEAHKEHDK